LESSVIKEAVIENLTNWLSPGTEDLLARVNEMKAMLISEDKIAALDEKYETMKMLIKGNVSPLFDLKSIDGGRVALTDLKGKNVYIDVWATWCGPCKAEIPHLKTLEESYHGKNIEFVSISVDEPKDEQKWKDMIADKELKGIQLMSDNGWNIDFVQDYLIRGIPRFILLDVEGNIVSADAPRPSSGEELTNMIDELI
jgi:thiol-disulfide isomerase/thioredoxin